MMFPMIVKELVGKNINVLFTIIGEGKDKGQLKKIIDSMRLSNYFKFLGHVNHSQLYEIIEGQYDDLNNDLK